MCLGEAGWARERTPLYRLVKQSPRAVKTVNANDGLGGDTLQKYLNQPE